MSWNMCSVFLIEYDMISLLTKIVIKRLTILRTFFHESCYYQLESVSACSDNSLIILMGGLYIVNFMLWPKMYDSIIPP